MTFSLLSRACLIAAAIISLSACATSRSLDDSFTDISASSELRAILFSDRSQDYGDVDITMDEGRLMLTGGMRNENGRQKLIANAWKADGVNQVIDEIVIGDKTGFTQGFEDSRIDQVLRARLIAANGISSGRYKFAVSRGVVYLIGNARNQTELDRALQIASDVSGVEKVVSHVLVPEPLTVQ